MDRTAWTRTHRLLFAVLLAFAALFALWGTWTGYFLDIDEPKYVAAAREMAATGDLLRPTLNGLPRLEKPPLAYWIMQPVLAAAGQTPSLLAARLPASLCYVGATAATALMAAALSGPVAGLAAGLMFLVSAVPKFEFLLMKSDAPYVCAFAFACLFLLRRLLGDRGLGTAVGAALSMGLGVLAKGPFAMIPLAGYAVAVLVGEGRGEGAAGAARRLARELPFGLGCLGLGAAPFLLWGLAASGGGGADYLAGLLADFHKNTTEAGVLAPKKIETIGFYLFAVLGGFFPWGAWLPAAAPEFFRGLSRDRSWRVFFLATAFVLFLFCLFVFRLRSYRYVLPLLPLAAVVVARWFSSGERGRLRTALSVLAAAVVVGLTGFFAWKVWSTGRLALNLWDVFPLTPSRAEVLPLALACGLFLALFGLAHLPRISPSRRVLVIAAGLVPLLPAFFLAVPVTRSLEDFRPLPVSYPAFRQVLAEAGGRDLLVVHTAEFGRRYPDILAAVKDTAQDGAACTLAVGSPAEAARLLAEPGRAAEAFAVSHPEAARSPASAYFRSTAFRRAVAILEESDWPAVSGALGGAALSRIRSLELLTLHMDRVRMRAAVSGP